jgi:surface polysaccharide O-acyltransferase-like enzyme
MQLASLGHTFKIIGLLAALFVAAGHYVSTDEVSPGYSYTVNLVLLDAIGNGIFRLAVPAFALASGFFYFLSYQHLGDWPRKLRQRLHTIVTPYLIASFIFLLAFCFAYWWFQRSLPTFTPRFILDSLLLHPHSVQLWYLRDLMVLVLIAPLFNPRSGWLPWLLAPIATCWLLEINFLPRISGWYLINLETLLFFALGGYLSRRPQWLERASQLPIAALITLSALWLLLSAGRISIFPGLTVWYQEGYTLTSLLLFKATLIVGLFLLFNAAYALRQHEQLLRLSRYGFFLYLFHFFPLNEVLYRISDRFIEEAYRFWLCGPLAVLITLAAAMFCERWMPTLYSLINGGRGQRLPVQPAASTAAAD